MKKRIILAALAIMAAALAGCGNDSDKAWLDEIKASDYVEPGEYKGIQVTQADPEVTDDEREAYINNQLKFNPPRGVIEGDTVNIDYVGKKDGEAFENGTASGANLVIGSGQFIEGFEEGLIGVKTGDTVDLDLTFPENYGAAEMAGQNVVFTVTLNHIFAQEAQELTDEFVKRQAIEGVDTVEGYKEYVDGLLMERAQSSYETAVENAIADSVISACEFKKEPPEAMVTRYTQTLTQNLTAQAASYGMTLVQFMANYGMNESNYEENIKSEAVKSAKQYIVLQAIADKENISVSEEDVENALTELAQSSGYDSAEDIKDMIDRKDYSEFLMGQKVMDMLRENAQVSAQ